MGAAVCQKWQVEIWLGIAGLVCFCFYPGVGGPFLLDDYRVLSTLGDYGVIDSFDKLKQYMLGGLTGPGGRPLALLSFAINSQTWPAQPHHFILTNIVIHAINSVLVGIFTTLLLRSANFDARIINCIGVFAAACWGLHPMQVSSVLYIVQRMTLLASSFSLLALILYLVARQAVLVGSLRRAAVLSLGSALAAVLSFFSKEIAVLLPLQLFLVETFILYSGAASNVFLRIAFRGVILPLCLVVLVYLGQKFFVGVVSYLSSGNDQSYGRAFTLFERIFTEFRVVGDYLFMIFVPTAQSPGVFFDNYTVSKNLLTPLSTLVWFILHVSFISVAVCLRRRVPWLYFGVCWFYASHLLESSVVMLELRFDHRNYLPSLGPCILIGFILSRIRAQKVQLAVAMLWVGLLAIMLYFSASLWGRPLLQALYWVEKNPTSARTLDNAATVTIATGGQSDKALEFLGRSALLAPSVSSELKYISLGCATFDGKPVDWSSLGARLGQDSTRDWGLYEVLGMISRMHKARGCDLLTLDGYRALLKGYRENPLYKMNMTSIMLDSSEISVAFEFNRPDIAKEVELGRNLLSIPLGLAMERAGIFATNGHLDIAIERLDYALQISRQLHREDEFTMQNAEEMLQLIKVEYDETSSVGGGKHGRD